MKKKKLLLVPLIGLSFVAASCDTPTPSSSTNETATDTNTKEVEKYAISSELGEGAKLIGLPSGAAEGAEVKFKVTLEEEKELSYVTVDGENVLEADAEGYFSFVMPAKKLTVTAVTADKLYAVNVTQVPGATIALSETRVKKGTTVEVRVSITDPSKLAPKVLAGEEEVLMTEVEGSLSTFKGSFVNPGREVTVTLSLTDAPKRFSIVDKEGDGTLVHAPESAVAGEKVTFSLGLAEGYEYVGAPTVNLLDSPESSVEVTANEDGTFSFVMPESGVTISRPTGASIYRITQVVTNPEGAEHPLAEKDVTLPEYATFGEEVKFLVKANDYLEADVVTLDGKALEKKEDGNYSFLMPSHAAKIAVSTKVRYANIVLHNTEHVTLQAYRKVNDEYQLIVDNKAAYRENVYIKAVGSTVEGITYGPQEIKFRYTENGSWNHMTVNEDGYYAATSAWIRDMSYGLEVQLTETRALFSENSIVLGTHKGLFVDTKGVAKEEKCPLTIDRFGLMKYGHNKASTSDYYLSSADEEHGTFAVKSEDLKGGYFANGLIYVASSKNSYSTNSVSLFLANSSALSNEVLGNSASSYPDKYVAKLSEGERSVFAYVYKDAEGYLNVKNVTVEYRLGSSLTEKGAIFQVKEGEALIGTFTNKNDVLTDFAISEPKTYTGEEGSLALDGVCNVTFTNGDNVKKGTYLKSDNALQVKIGEEYSFYRLDDAAQSYSKANYSVGRYSGPKNGSSYYWLELQEGFVASAEFSEGKGAVTLESDGSLKIAGQTQLLLSQDGATAYVTVKGSTIYHLYKNVAYKPGDANGWSYKKLTKASGSEFLSAIMPKNEAVAPSLVYFDGSKKHVGLSVTYLSGTDLTVSGTVFQLKEGDKLIATLKNESGKIADFASDGLAGTYANTDASSSLATLVLNGYGGGTLGETEITYTVTASGVKIVVGLTTYEISLSGVNFTIDSTVTETLPAFAGKNYRGKYHSDFDECDEYFYISFSSDKKTFRCSASNYDNPSVTLGGSYMNNNNLDCDYSYDGATFKLSATIKSASNPSGVLMTFVYNSVEDTFKCEKNFDTVSTTKNMVMRLVA